jgi:hypothetical protein
VAIPSSLAVLWLVAGNESFDEPSIGFREQPTVFLAVRSKSKGELHAHPDAGSTIPCAAAVAILAALFLSTDGRAAESLRIEGIATIV